jgi:hypothetical protein
MNTIINYIARTGNPATIIRETVARGVLIPTLQGSLASICEGCGISEADTETIQVAAEQLSFYNDCITAYCKLEDGTCISIERDD